MLKINISINDVFQSIFAKGKIFKVFASREKLAISTISCTCISDTTDIKVVSMYGVFVLRQLQSQIRSRSCLAS